VHASGESPAGTSARKEAERRARALAERAARSPLSRYAPRLFKAILGTFFIGVARELGPGVGILAILIWLWVSFDAIVLGAPWARLRTEDAAAAEGSG
jgi:hypothetical protein